ncbi:polysaccharide export protein EpsE [uncultured Oxalicibacterium sp.]|uniref:polysaccharide export protein EpsE n=1 Tax=uncultured Oxalicibacterium sp. TaxID=1168540 RepID=UPI0025CF4F6F|nr:polysaccharide export protein EpsE [uncultured Oxalicibacterium sp.]
MKKIMVSLCAMALLAFGAIAQAQDIQLGAGDMLKIDVYGNPDLSVETRVSDQGTISYPLVGEVKVGGMSPMEAEKKIASLLESGGFIRKPHVNLVVTQMQSQQLSVLGQVNKPGRFPVDGKRSLTDILAMAGGLNEDADDRITLVRTRDGKTTREQINLADIMQADGNGSNPDLLPGDVIYVSRAPRFYIYGEVQKPGSYRLEPGMSILQALSVGGGLSPRGTERGVRVKRRDENGVMHILEVKHEDRVQVNDVIYVKESFF